jgi:DNA-binding response OmpR family regulator
MTPTRILIVDDNPDNVTILRDRLQARGYETTVAHDGEQALAMIMALRPGTAGAERLPDLILLDVMLPKVHGFEVARRIKSDPSLPFIPIIMQTALDTTADKVIGLDSGADDYITKPIDLAELEARIRSLLRIKSLQEQVERQRASCRRSTISSCASRAPTRSPGSTTAGASRNGWTRRSSTRFA